MARHLVALRLTILRNRFLAARQNPRQALPAVVSAVVLVYLAATYGGPFLDSLTMTGEYPDLVEFTIMISFSLVLSWMLTPLTLGGRSDLDPQRFQLLAIRPTALTRGLTAAAFVSPWPAATLGLVVAMLWRVSASPGEWAVIAVDVVLLVAMCVLAGRTTITLAGLASRTRRGRELLVLLQMVVAAVPLLLVWELSRQFDDPASESSVADVVRWVPLAWPGWAMGEAAGGGLTAAAVATMASALAVVAVFWLWSSLIQRSLAPEDRSTVRRHGGDPFAGFARRLPADRRGAVAALELRLFAREPGRIGPWLLDALLLGGMFTALVAIAADPPVLGAFAITFAVVPRRLNEWGVDAASLWLNVEASGDPVDDLLGRDLGAAVIDVPLITAVAVMLAAVSRSWAYLPAGWVIGLGALLATYGAMRFIAVRMGRAEAGAKDGDGPAQRPDLLLGLIGIFAWFVVMAPFGAGLVLVGESGAGWLALLVPASLAVGGAIWWLSLRSVGGWLRRNQTALLRALGA